MTVSCATSSGQKKKKVSFSSHRRAETEDSGNDNYHQPMITHHPCPAEMVELKLYFTGKQNRNLLSLTILCTYVL